MVLVLASLFSVIGYVACWKYFSGAQASSRSPQRYQFSIWPTFGVMVPLIGIFVGWKFLVIGAKAKSKTMGMDGIPVETLVDLIEDSATASQFAISDSWLGQNWHTLNNWQKSEWVRTREKHLKSHLGAAIDAPTFIKALQDADKEFARAQAG